MNKIKKYRNTIISLCFALVCIMGYQLVGSYVAVDGMLVEPFYLIPLTYLGFSVAFISFVAVNIGQTRKNSSEKKV